MRYSIPRKSRRVPLSTLVNLKLERLSGAVTEITSDLSLGGMFVPSDTPAEIGSLVAFEFKVGEDLVEGTGEVVWQRKEGDGPDQPPGMGIRFRYLSPGSRERIFRLVQRYTQEGDEALSPVGSEEQPAAAQATPPVAAVRSEDALRSEDGAEKMADRQEREPSSPRQPVSRSEAIDLTETIAEPVVPKREAPASHPAKGFVLPEILRPPREEEVAEAVEAVAEEPVEEPVEEEAVAKPQASEVAEKGPDVEFRSRTTVEAEPPVAVAEPASAEEVEIPGWLRADPPDLPDLPVAPAAEPVLPGDMTPVYDGDDTGGPTESTGEWRLRGAGYVGAKSSRSLKLDGRKIVFGLFVLLLAAAAIYRLAGPLIARFVSGDESTSEVTEVASPVATDPGTPRAAGEGQSSPATAGEIAGDSAPPPAAGEGQSAAPVAAEPGAAKPGNAETDEVADETTTSGGSPAAGSPGVASPAEPASERKLNGLNPEGAVAKPKPAPPEPASVVVRTPMTRISKIHWRTVAGGTLVTIEADGAISADRFKRLRLGQPPPRELVRFTRVSRPFEPTRLAVGSAELTTIRTGLHSGRELHVVLDLADPTVAVVSADTVGTELRILLRRP